MDAEWLAAIGAKNYLFPDRWPAYAWLINLAYPLLIGVLLYVRRRSGQLTPMQLGIGAGALILFLIFLLSLPFNAGRIALAVQLQIPRIFWMLDFLATALIVSWLVQRAETTRRCRDVGDRARGRAAGLVHHDRRVPGAAPGPVRSSGQ